MKIALLFDEHPSQDLDLFFELQGLKEILKGHELYVGPIPLWNDPRSFRLSLSHYNAVLFGGLGAEERKAFLAEAAPLGIPCIPFGAVPSVYARMTRIENNDDRTVFFASYFDESSYNKRQEKLFHLLESTAPTLWAAESEDSFALAPEMGMNAFYAPRAPYLHSSSIAGATRVISTRLVPALLAASRGIPSALVSFSPEMNQVAETFGIPVIQMGVRRSTAKLKAEITEIFAKYPWVTTSQKILDEVSLFRKDLEKIGIQVPPLTKEERSSLATLHLRSEFSLHLCSISDSNYLPFLEGFITNAIQQSDMALNFHILALDDRTEERLKERFKNLNLQIVKLDTLWSKDELPQILERPIGFRAFSSKPRLIEHVLKKVQQEVFYCDSDVYFYSSPSSLLKAFPLPGNLCLFPHWNDQFPEARKDGLYNAGMLGVRPGAEAFLKWWSKECYQNCRFDPEGGIVGDQAYLDFAPIFFEGVSIYRKGDQNVARWNLKSLGVKMNELIEPIPRLSTGQPIRTYHAAFLDDDGIAETKVAWDHLTTFFGPRPQGTAALLELLWKHQRRYSLKLARAFKLSPLLKYFPLMKREFRRMHFLTTRLFRWVEIPFKIKSALKIVLGKTPSITPPNPWEEKQDQAITPWIQTQRKLFLAANQKQAENSHPSKKAS